MSIASESTLPASFVSLQSTVPLFRSLCLLNITRAWACAGGRRYRRSPTPFWTKKGYSWRNFKVIDNIILYQVRIPKSVRRSETERSHQNYQNHGHHDIAMSWFNHTHDTGVIRNNSCFLTFACPTQARSQGGHRGLPPPQNCP